MTEDTKDMVRISIVPIMEKGNPVPSLWINNEIFRQSLCDIWDIPLSKLFEALPRCKWKYDAHANIYESGCDGGIFYMIGSIGTLKANAYYHCPNCGLLIEECK